MTRSDLQFRDTIPYTIPARALVFWHVPMLPESVPHCSGWNSITFVGQWLQIVLDVAYLCWRASRTSALSSRPVVVRLLPERGRSFTSPGFSLCLLSILYTVAIAGWWYFSPWRSQTDRSQKVDFWGGQSCVGFNSIVQRLYDQFNSFLPDMLPGIYTSYQQFFRKPLNV